MQIKIFWR